MAERIKEPVEQVLPAIAGELQRLGIVATFEYKRKPLDVQGNPLDGGTGEYTLTLPRALAVKAKLSTRALTERAIELFTHHFKTGDASFDDAIHTSTDTPAQTTALLQDADIRRLVVAQVTALRPLELDGARVIVRFPGYASGSGMWVIAFAEMLLRSSPT
jgi:hypothetical protein